MENIAKLTLSWENGAVFACDPVQDPLELPLIEEHPLTGAMSDSSLELVFSTRSTFPNVSGRVYSKNRGHSLGRGGFIVK